MNPEVQENLLGFQGKGILLPTQAWLAVPMSIPASIKLIDSHNKSMATIEGQHSLGEMSRAFSESVEES